MAYKAGVGFIGLSGEKAEELAAQEHAQLASALKAFADCVTVEGDRLVINQSRLTLAAWRRAYELVGSEQYKEANDDVSHS